MIVVDASALIGFLLGRPEAIAGLTERFADREHEILHAPEVIDLETMNALRRLTLNGHVSERRATQAVASLGTARLIRYPHAPLRERVWKLRNALPAYDAAYLALTEASGDGVLVTADAALASRARASIGDGRVHLIA